MSNQETSVKSKHTYTSELQLPAPFPNVIHRIYLVTHMPSRDTVECPADENSCFVLAQPDSKNYMRSMPTGGLSTIPLLIPSSEQRPLSASLPERSDGAVLLGSFV